MSVRLFCAGLIDVFAMGRYLNILVKMGLEQTRMRLKSARDLGTGGTNDAAGPNRHVVAIW